MAFLTAEPPSRGRHALTPVAAYAIVRGTILQYVHRPGRVMIQPRQCDASTVSRRRNPSAAGHHL